MGDLGFGEVFRRLYEGSMMALAEKLYLFYASDKCFAQFFPGNVERLGEHASLACDSHEIGITNPSRKRVEMDVLCDAGASRLAQIHSEIQAVGTVNAAQ